MESLTLAWWNMFITKLLMRIRLGPSFPAHHHQYSQLALVKKRHVTSSQWCIPASSPGSSGAEQTWSHTEMTMCDEKSYKGLFSNVPLVQSELAELRKQKGAVFMVLVTSVLSCKTAYVSRLWKLFLQRQIGHVGSSQGPKDKAV